MSEPTEPKKARPIDRFVFLDERPWPFMVHYWTTRLDVSAQWRYRKRRQIFT